jgi:proteasome lid subunit RPN8/RPN11
MRDLRPARDRLRFPRHSWPELLAALSESGGGRRESGAFLLAPRGSRKVQNIVFYDDLDPNCLVGGIVMQPVVYSRLWQICRDSAQRVIADVHTHPGPHVAQSHIDRDHPLISTPGHVALIVPNFAQGRVRRRDVGVHRYDGDSGWTSWYGWGAYLRISLR